VNVFVDTSAFLALLWRRDANHRHAVATWKALLARGARPVTTDLVVAETVALTRGRAGYQLSVRAGEQLQRDPFEIVFVDRPLLRNAWAIYRKYRDHVLSLCDCVSFASMRQRKIGLAFAYDDDFEGFGLERAGPE